MKKKVKVGDTVIDDLSLTEYIVRDVDENGFETDDNVYHLWDNKRWSIKRKSDEKESR